MKTSIFALATCAAGLVALTQSSAANPPNGYFRMQTMFQIPNDRCLESNKVVPGAARKGATFLDRCQDVSGQLWKAVPIGRGWFRLQSMFLERENFCLEGSKPFAPGDPLKGAARMDPCGNFTGQNWRFLRKNDGFFQLTNEALEDENHCLEGSAPDAANDPLAGAARMDPCGNFSGQLWKLTPAD